MREKKREKNERDSTLDSFNKPVKFKVIRTWLPEARTLSDNLQFQFLSAKFKPKTLENCSLRDATLFLKLPREKVPFEREK